MTRAHAYEHGRVEGEHWGEQDALERAHDTHHWILTFREDARIALDNRRMSATADEWAARCLGVARGYRELVR